MCGWNRELCCVIASLGEQKYVDMYDTVTPLVGNASMHK